MLSRIRSTVTASKQIVVGCWPALSMRLTGSHLGRHRLEGCHNEGGCGTGASILLSEGRRFDSPALQCVQV